MKVEATIHFGKQGSKKQVPKSKPTVIGRTPRIAKLMALAIRFEGLIADGTVADYSELAELAHVSRARITQIMNLLLLSPDLQETVLFLPPTANGGDMLTLGYLQTIALESKWEKQRKKWKELSAAIGQDNLQQLAEDVVFGI